MFKNHLLLFLGITLGITHILILIFTIQLMYLDIEADWPLYWFVFVYVDLPISLLYPITYQLIAYMIPFAQISTFLRNFLPYPIYDIDNFIFPFIFFGILGTIWYFFLPKVMVFLINSTIKFYKFLGKNGANLGERAKK